MVIFEGNDLSAPHFEYDDETYGLERGWWQAPDGYYSSAAWRSEPDPRSNEVLEETLEAFGSGWEWGWDLTPTDELINQHIPREREDAFPQEVNPWECRIGLSRFIIPPININVSQTFKAGGMTGGAIRQQSPPKFNSGHKETLVTMTLYFPNYESIWGVEDEVLRLSFDEPHNIDSAQASLPRAASDNREIDDFMSTMRGLIAQFKYAPFLPVRNSFLNKNFDITGVVLKDLTISTVPNYPFCLVAQLTMYKFNHKVYLPMIDHFDQAIHWGRFRSYCGRAVNRLARASAPIRSWHMHNTINNSEIDTGSISPSIRTVRDIVDSMEYNETPDEIKFKRHSSFQVEDFNFFFPLHTPQRVDVPTSGIVEDDTSPSPFSVVNRGGWNKLLASLGINVDVFPEARYEAAREYAEEQGLTYIEPGSTGLRGLFNFIESYGITLEGMTSSRMNQYVQERLNDKGLARGTEQYDREASAMRREWLYLAYRLLMEDPYLANMLGQADRNRRKLTINEWELPMFPLDLDKRYVEITGVSVSMGNIISRLQLQMEDEPTHQHIGGADTRVDISMLFHGEKAEEELARLRVMFDGVSGLARLEQGHGVLGFMGVKSVMTALCGIRYVIPLSFEVDTIPNQPGSFEVRITLTDFDIFQQKREQLDASQQAVLAEQFGKRNPFLRVKQLWGSFNAYPDFPLSVHDDEGKLVGHLDPDYYFRSFDVIDSDIIEPTEALPVEGNPSSGAENTGAVDEISDAIEAILPLVPGSSGSSDSTLATMLIHNDRGNTVEFTENGTILDSLGRASIDEDVGPQVHNEAFVDGLTPGSAYNQPLLDGSANPADQFYAMAQDMQYRDKSGRMIRAFPTYMLWLIDEGGFGMGVKLFDNFYGLQSVVDMSIVESKDPMSDTMVLRVSNLYSKLSTPFHDLLEDRDVTSRIINTFTSGMHRMLTGMSDKYLVDLETMQLKPGVRVHLRMGYGSNPNKLDTVFNGTITEVQEGEIMTIVAQSDAMELGALVETENETAHSGRIDGSLKGLYLSEPRDLMVTLLSQGASKIQEYIAWSTRGDIFSENRYGISHFGSMLYTYMDGADRSNNGLQRDKYMSVLAHRREQQEEEAEEDDPSSTAGAFFDMTNEIVGGAFSAAKYFIPLLTSGRAMISTRRDMEIFKRNIYPGNGVGIGQYLGGDIGDIGLGMSFEEDMPFIGTGIGPSGERNIQGDFDPLEAIEAAADMHSPVESQSTLTSSAPTLSQKGRRQVVGHFSEYQPNFSGPGRLPALLEIMNITNPNDEDGPFDEVSFRTNTYMRTVWDIFQTCAALLPNYIVAVRPFEDRSTVFYGKPHWLYTSGVIPLTKGTYPDDGPAINEPDKDQQHILNEARSFANQNDQQTALERFVNGVSFWENEGGSSPFVNMSASSGESLRDVQFKSNGDGAVLAAQAAIAAGFAGEDLVTAVAVAGAETGGTWDPSLTGSVNSNGTRDHGLFQINDVHGLSEAEMYDPWKAAEWAYNLYNRAGKNFGDWAVHTDWRGRNRAHTNAYAKHMDTARRAVQEAQGLISSSRENININPGTSGLPKGVGVDDGYVTADPYVGGPSIGPANSDAQRLGPSRTSFEDQDSEWNKIFDQIVDNSKRDDQVDEIISEFKSNFPSDIETEEAFMSSRLLTNLTEEHKNQVKEQTFDESVEMFIDWILSNPYRAGWLVRVAIRRTLSGFYGGISFVLGGASFVFGGPYAQNRAQRGLNTLLSGSDGEWDFSIVYPAFGIFCGYGAEIAEDYMRSNVGAGRRNETLLSGLYDVFADKDWGMADEFDMMNIVGNVVGSAVSVVTNMLRMNMLMLSNGMTMATDMQKETNILNKMLNDSRYYQSGRDADGRITNELLYYADNPFTREYGEPVVEVREPFERLHNIGSFQHIIHNGTIESMEEVATVVTAVSNDGDPVTVHFDKGMPPDRQIETVVDTHLFWDEPSGWFGLKKLRHPIQHLRSVTRSGSLGIGSADIPSDISAKRVALAHLRRNLEDVYRGEITILGDASIRPHDLVYIFDVYSRIYGFARVGQVVHHFTPETGFVTQITPNLIVHVNDPARWNAMARVKGNLAAHAVREVARRNLAGSFDQANSLTGSTRTAVSMDELTDMVDDQIQGSLQYTQGSGAIITDSMSRLAIGNAKLTEMTRGMPIIGRRDGLAWGPWRWFRDNLLDQHGCAVDFLTRNGQPMDGNLSYAQGNIVSKPNSKRLVIRGLNIAEIPTLGSGGERTIETSEVLPSISWNERDGYSDNAKSVNMFHAASVAHVRNIAFNEEFLTNYASEVYWVRIDRIIDGDTFEVLPLGIAPFGVYEPKSGITLGDSNKIRLYGVQAPEDDHQNLPDAVRDTFSHLPGIQATEYAKSRLLGQEVALRMVTPNAEDQFNRALANVFINAPLGYEEDERKKYLLDAAGLIPVKSWDSYTFDGRPHTFDWEMVTVGHGTVYARDLINVQPGRGARGGAGGNE